MDREQEIEKLASEYWEGIDWGSRKALAKQSIEFLKQAGYRLPPEQTDKREAVDKIIRDNTPCYRDLFGGKCVFITGCLDCPDYFNSRQDTVDLILSLFSAELKMQEMLKFLVDKYWKNQEEDYGKGFITCITPNGIPEYWKEARRIVAQAQLEVEQEVGE